MTDARTRPVPRLSATPGFGAWVDACGGFLALSTVTSDMLMFVAGAGAFGHVDERRGRFVDVARRGNYSRGLAMIPATMR